MRTRRARSPMGGRLALTAAALVALAVVVGLPFTAATELSAGGAAPSSSVHPLPLQGSLPCANPTTDATSGFSYCVYVQNSGATAQSISSVAAQSAKNAAQLQIANSPVVQVEFLCTGQQILIGYVDFDLDLLGATIVHSPVQLRTSTPTGSEDYAVCTPGTYKETGWANISLSDLSSWQYALSGVYSGRVYVQDYNGTLVGNPTGFYVDVVPAIWPVTYFTIPLILIVIYELYQIGRDFSSLAKSRPTRLPPAETPPAGPAAPPGAPPVAGAPVAAPPGTAPPSTTPPTSAPSAPGAPASGSYPPSAPPPTAPPTQPPRAAGTPPPATGALPAWPTAAPSAAAGGPARPASPAAPAYAPAGASPGGQPPAYPGPYAPPPAPGTAPNSPWRAAPPSSAPPTWQPPGPSPPTGAQPSPQGGAPPPGWYAPPQPAGAPVQPGPPPPGSPAGPPLPQGQPVRRPGDPPAPPSGGSA